MTIAGVDLPDKDTYTYGEYAQLPEGAPYELIQGQLVREPAPTTGHQDVSMQLATLLNNHVRSRDLGRVYAAPTDVRLSETDTFHPDILFLSNERLDRVREQYVDGAPDLVVEVLSPSTRDRDWTTKRKAYEEAGVREYWIVDPDAQTAEVLVNGEKGYEAYGGERVIASTVLKAFELDVAAFFQIIR